jgi:hypothetical protein
LYREQWAQSGIVGNHHAIPREILTAQQEQKWITKDGKQTSLDGIVWISPKVILPFSHDDLLKSVAIFVICDDQVGYHGFRAKWI